MPIVLTFQSRKGDRKVSKGPYPSIRLEGETIREHEGGPVIASHFAEGWRVDGQDYLRLDCETPVSVLWDGSPGKGSLATTGHFSSVDGIAYLDRRILAFVDVERHDWYLKRDGRHKPVLLLVPVNAS